MLSLKALRKKRPALADLLNYAAVVDEGIVLNKDGSLMAAWYYQGQDLSSSSESDLNSITERLSSALGQLGSGWMTHHDAIRCEARGYPTPEESAFPDPVTRAIDDERRAQFEAEGAHFESMYAFVVTYLPPHISNRRLAELMFEGEDKTERNIGARILESFKEKISALEDALSVVPLRLHRMGLEYYLDEFNNTHANDQFLQYINFALTGENHPINLPPCPMYLDAILGAREFFPGTRPKIGNQLIRVLSINGFPDESTPALLAALDRLPIPYRWSTRFIYMDPEEAKAHVGAFRRKWGQKKRGFIDQIFQTSRGAVDRDAAEMESQTEEAQGEASSQKVTFGYYTSCVVLMSENPQQLEEAATQVRRAITALGFACIIETLNCVEAWLGTLPGDGIRNIRRPLMHTLNLADLLPIASIWAGHDRCPCPFYPDNSPPLLHAGTEGHTPFRLNLHVGDLGHTLVFGPPGSGKSVLLSFITAQFRRYPRAQIFSFDKGRSIYALTKACGGEHYDIGSDRATITMMPLAEIDTQSDRSWAEEWIAMCAELQLGEGKIGPEHRTAIHRAMLLLAEAPRSERTITNFVTNVQSQDLRNALEYYTISGTWTMLDGKDETLGSGSFQTFEIEELMQRGNKAVIPTLLYLFRRIQRSLDGRPTFLPIDEAWVALSHPVFKEKIREWLKEFRKKNCIVLLATQNLSDAARSGIVDVLIETCPTKILLPNDKAADSDEHGEGGARALYASFGLNETQIGIVARAVPKREYYFMSPEGRRLIRLNLRGIALAFAAVSSNEDLDRVRELEREHGPNWPAHWLRRRRVSVPESLMHMFDAPRASVAAESRNGAAIVVETDPPELAPTR